MTLEGAELSMSFEQLKRCAQQVLRDLLGLPPVRSVSSGSSGAAEECKSQGSCQNGEQEAAFVDGLGWTKVVPKASIPAWPARNEAEATESKFDPVVVATVRVSAFTQSFALQPDDRFTELLRTADFHLIPQRAEAADLVLPSKLGGILATGRPVIAMSRPDAGLTKEVTGAGLVVPPGDTAALAAAITLLEGDASLCASLGEGARMAALARWDKTAILHSLEQTLLRSIESGKNADSALGSPRAQAAKLK